jgi:hypothetical protein
LKKRLLAACVAIALLWAAPALAQGDGGPDASHIRVRLGPLMMNPTISISNIGVDHNVFNDPPDKAPKQDFTFTVTPLSDFWIRLGTAWISASLNESINWYQKYASERTANNTYRLGLNVPGPHVNVRLDGSYINARERPGFEIDTRAARKETNFSGAVDFHALSKSFIGLTAARVQTRFAGDAEFLDPQTGVSINLRTSLSRIDTSYGVNARHQLTPLTSLTFAATRSYDTFEFSPDRNTVSTSATVSAAFAPAALVTGGASIGISNFKPSDPTLPGYRGVIGSVDLVYILLGSTRFSANGGRGVQYSYDNSQPYYIQSRIGGSVAQQIFGPLDVQLRGEISLLDYRNRAGVPIVVPDRVDHVTTVGIGFGIHMGKDLRLAFNVDQNNRQTQVAEHAYEKFLVGTSLTYGF